MSKELDELKQTLAEHGLSEKYADEVRQMEMLEEQTAKLEKANAEMRKTLAQSKEQRTFQDSLNELREDIAQIKMQTGEKPLTKEDIMSITDNHKRLKAIRENMHLFKTTDTEQTPQQKANELANMMELKHYGITAESFEHLTIEDVLKTVPTGVARTYAINKIIERERNK